MVKSKGSEVDAGAPTVLRPHEEQEIVLSCQVLAETWEKALPKGCTCVLYSS